MNFFKKILNPGYNGEVEAIARDSALTHEEKCKAIASVIGALYEKDRNRGLECIDWFSRLQTSELHWSELETVHFRLFLSGIAMKLEAGAEQKPDGKWSFAINSDTAGRFAVPKGARVVTTLKPDGSKTLRLQSVEPSTMQN